MRVIGLDQVPGKSVPRYGWVFPTSSDEALRFVLDLLTPEQRTEAIRVLQASEHIRKPAGDEKEAGPVDERWRINPARSGIHMLTGMGGGRTPMRVQFHIASSLATAAVMCQSAVPPKVQAQGFELRAKTTAYQSSRVYDRLTDSTREAFTLKESSRPFGLKSRVWVDVSFTYPGRRLTVAPKAVVLTLTSFTPARGGWAFARPHKLRVVYGRRVMLEAPAADYEKLRARLFDSGRRETLSFDIPTEQFVAMGAQAEIELKAGKARMRLRERGMEMLREIARRITPTAGAR